MLKNVRINLDKHMHESPWYVNSQRILCISIRLGPKMKILEFN